MGNRLLGVNSVADKFVVLLDLDSTVYDLLTPTLNYVNDRYGMSLTPADITEWRWDKKYNVDLMHFWNSEGVYYNLQPFPGAIEAIKDVHEMGIRQVFLSSANFRFGTEKFRAVDRDFPFIGAKDTLLTGGNKDLVKGDVLVDDGPHNLEEFSKCGGYTILANLCSTPYCQYPSASKVMTNWNQYVEMIKSIG